MKRKGRVRPAAVFILLASYVRNPQPVGPLSQILTFRGLLDSETGRTTNGGPSVKGDIQDIVSHGLPHSVIRAEIRESGDPLRSQS